MRIATIFSHTILREEAQEEIGIILSVHGLAARGCGDGRHYGESALPGYQPQTYS